MRRIAVIGCGGSGKSTLARELGAALDLPVVHLDVLFWRPGWTETPRDEWRAIVERAIAEPAWVMDGNYGGTLAPRLVAADAVVFLDLPTAVCLWRVVRRRIAHRGGGRRDDMAEGCAEQLDAAFLWWILTYRRRRRPEVLAQLDAMPRDRVAIVLRSRAEVRAFARAMAARAG